MIAAADEHGLAMVFQHESSRRTKPCPSASTFPRTRAFTIAGTAPPCPLRTSTNSGGPPAFGRALTCSMWARALARAAIPLAQRGCRVVALEPAGAMLEELRAKAGDTNVSIVIGEGARLPLPSHRFQAVVIARLLYLTNDWSQVLNEARRVLAAGGSLLHEWGNGRIDEEWVRIREEARSLFEQAGVPSPFHPGVRSETAIEETLDGLRMVRETDVVLGPARASHYGNSSDV